MTRTRLQFLPGLLAAAAVAAGCNDGATAPIAASESSRPAPSAAQASAGGNQGFGFNGTASGFPTGSVFLTGGGSYDPATASNAVSTGTFAHSGGGFRCTTGVAQGPINGCAAGEGVRWDTAQLLASTTFKCTGTDAAKQAVTGDKTVVLRADFYRAGNGVDASFTAQMIVSENDLAPDIAGVQNLWVQGVGCGSAVAHFN
jgi:hypothetical protein